MKNSDLNNTMTNILLNYYNFDGDWTHGQLDKYFRNKRTVIVPLAYRESQIWDESSWQSVYGKGGEKYDNILRPFLSYGLKEKEIVWLNYFDKQTDFHRLLADAEVLFFTGGMPEKAIARMRSLCIENDVINSSAVIAGASAGAMLQLQRYHITPDEDYDSYEICNGLGLVRDLDLEVHFLDTPLQNECTRRAIEDLQLPVYQMWHEGGLLVENGIITQLGSVRKVSR